MLLAKACLIEHRDATQLAVQQRADRQSSGISGAAGDDDAPDALAPQRGKRERLVHDARAGFPGGDDRLEQPTPPAGRQLPQPGNARWRTQHQDPPDEPAFPHDPVEYQPARNDADQPGEQLTLLSTTTA